MRPRLTRAIARQARLARQRRIAIELAIGDGGGLDGIDRRELAHLAMWLNRWIAYAAGEEPARAAATTTEAPKGLQPGETPAEAATRPLFGEECVPWQSASTRASA